jgi:disulfide oxidoreductase YuzD
MKIQQMAFMLVTLMIFFSMVALIYFTISLSNLKKDVSRLQDEEAMELARKMSGTPELAFTATSDCSSCIDYDKAKQMAENSNLKEKYKDLWNINYLAIECIITDENYPDVYSADCSEDPDLNPLVLIEESESYSTKTAFVTLARWDSGLGNYRYDLGRIHTSNLLE